MMKLDSAISKQEEQYRFLWLRPRTSLGQAAESSILCIVCFRHRMNLTLFKQMPKHMTLQKSMCLILVL